MSGWYCASWQRLARRHVEGAVAVLVRARVGVEDAEQHFLVKARRSSVAQGGLSDEPLRQRRLQRRLVAKGVHAGVDGHRAGLSQALRVVVAGENLADTPAVGGDEWMLDAEGLLHVREQVPVGGAGYRIDRIVLE